MSVPLAWLQLKREPVRLLVALSGVAFAVILVFMQIGFNDALFRSAVRAHTHLQADIFLISPGSLYLAGMKSFSRRRLYQAQGFEGVQSVAPLYSALAPWKNAITGTTRLIWVSGINPADAVWDLPEVTANLGKLALRDNVIFDRASRPEYGTIAQDFLRGGVVQGEVADRRVTVAGLFTLGTTFGIDGSLITSDLNFLRIFPRRSKGLIEMGLVKLKPGTDVESMRRTLEAGLPRDVLVMTKAEFMAHEKKYWDETTPIGFVFAFGSIMGLVVGGVIVYQILFADISAHLPEYATLKAMGYTNLYLFSVVLQEALLLAVLGYLPGSGAAAWLYRVTEGATRLPIFMTWQRSAQVLALTVGMCSLAGAIALRKIRSADPAEIF